MTELVDRDDLVKMVKQAYNACYSEYMNCPWCSGHIGYENEYHDDSCKWKDVEKEHPEDE